MDWKKIRTWLGLFILMAGGHGITQRNGLPYLLASIILMITGLLLMFIHPKKKK